VNDLKSYCVDIAQRAKAASRAMTTIPTDRKRLCLICLSALEEHHRDEILAANEKDVSNAVSAGLTSAQIDRLRLTPDRLMKALDQILQVAWLPDPVGQIRSSTIHPVNGLVIHKVGVPLGVIFFIYESRPNVTLDAAALCIMSGNAVILRGGREAIHTNTVLLRVLQDKLRESALPADAVQLVTTPDRAAVGHLLKMKEYIDLAIPRGGESLIRRVVAEATMPVLKHFTGNCHVYVEKSADPDMAEGIILNAKCQRPGVCNAAESLLIDAAIAETFLPRVAAALQAKGVELRGCPATCQLIRNAKPASEEDYSTEFLDLILSVKVVAGLDEAIAHIERYGSHHTDAIVTNDLTAARRFTAEVDSAAVMVNASTRFNDGHELGLGAEIGISTDKFHARGPCGLLELSSYKYVVIGSGQVRE
jgi:glutamate-5-semialdehyde dehydrogenase